MAGQGLTRTDYWNRVTGTVRTGNTRHGETVTDIEDFLLPYSQAVIAGLHSWGVADGLSVTATANQAALSISAGTAIDASGQVITLAAGGLAVTDPGIDPNDVANIATVSVDTTGLSLSTANHSGTQFLTIRYLEVSDELSSSTAPKLHHAPWLRLQDSTGFPAPVSMWCWPASSWPTTAASPRCRPSCAGWSRCPPSDSSCAGPRPPPPRRRFRLRRRPPPSWPPAPTAGWTSTRSTALPRRTPR